MLCINPHSHLIDPESYIQLRLIAPTTYPLILASVANLFGRVIPTGFLEQGAEADARDEEG
jgi:hypothetical protein